MSGKVKMPVVTPPAKPKVNPLQKALPVKAKVKSDAEVLFAIPTEQKTYEDFIAVWTKHLRSVDRTAVEFNREFGKQLKAVREGKKFGDKCSALEKLAEDLGVGRTYIMDRIRFASAVSDEEFKRMTALGLCFQACVELSYDTPEVRTRMLERMEEDNEMLSITEMAALRQTIRLELNPEETPKALPPPSADAQGDEPPQDPAGSDDAGSGGEGGGGESGPKELPSGKSVSSGGDEQKEAHDLIIGILKQAKASIERVKFKMDEFDSKKNLIGEVLIDEQLSLEVQTEATSVHEMLLDLMQKEIPKWDQMLKPYDN